MTANTPSTPRPRAPRAEIALEIRLDQAHTDADSRRAYEELYRVTDITLPDSFYLWLIDLFDLQPDDVYLDVSCGHGQLTALARRRGVNAHGLDLAFTALQAGQPTADPRLTLGNGQQLPFAAGSFTVVSNIGSLEHYVDMETAVSEMARVLRPGGRAFVLVPNTFSLLHNVWIAFRQGRTNIDIQPIQRYMARLEWQQLLEATGLRVDRTIKYEIERPRTCADWQRVLRHPKRLARLLAAPLVPLNLAFCFVFFCSKPQ